MFRLFFKARESRTDVKRSPTFLQRGNRGRRRFDGILYRKKIAGGRAG